MRKTISILHNSYAIRLVLILIVLIFNYTVYNNKLKTVTICNRTAEIFPVSDTFRINVHRSENTSALNLCVVTRIYGPQLDYLPVFALSLLQNDIIRIKILLVNTDVNTDISILRNTIDLLNDLVNRKDAVRLLDFGTPPSENTYGYYATDQALRYLYAEKENPENFCNYVTFTNADNIYANNLAEKLLPFMKENINMVAWTFSSHYFTSYFLDEIPQDSFNAQVVDGGTDKCARSWFQVGYLDLSAAVYRFEFLYKYQLLFQQEKEPYEAMSDSYFAVRAANITTSWILIRQTLSFHQ